MKQKKVNIVVPIYKEKFESFELISFTQLYKILGNHTITIIHPNRVNLQFVRDMGFKFESKSFSNELFDGIYGYNKLMLSPVLYKSFEDYEYILIYQTDAYVFRDELLDWSNKDYDYIGSPWIGRKQNSFHKMLSYFDFLLMKMLQKNRKEKDHLFKVGNGGFSLRRINSFITLSEKYEDYIKEHIIRSHNDFIPEDIFWSMLIPSTEDQLTVPDYREALNFGFDRRPHLAYKYNEKKIPFGVHGINKKNHIKFYKKTLVILK